MGIWISQSSIRETKEKMYPQFKEERILWLSPFRLVSFIAGTPKVTYPDLEIYQVLSDKVLTKFQTRKKYSVTDIAALYRVFDIWGKKFDSEIALRVIAKPEDKEILETVKSIRKHYYLNRIKNPVSEVPRLKDWVAKFSGDLQKYYHQFYIPKKDGSKRTISAPQEKLATVQRLILKQILYPNYPKGRFNPAHGFLPGKNILSNAEVHSNASVIVNLDLKNAFYSTTKGILFPALEDYFTRLGAKMIIQLCCLQGRLPQGAPTSPMLLNYALLKMDRQLNSIAQNMGWKYSRYADDLTFSCEEFGKDTVGVGKLIETVANEVVKEAGYKVNPQKIRVYRPKRAMKVTGLVLNSGQPTISRKLRRITRAKVHNFVHKGIGNLKQIAGYLSYVSLVHPEYAEKLRTKLQTHHLLPGSLNNSLSTTT